MKLSTTEKCLPKNVRKAIKEMYDFLDEKDQDGLSFFDEAEMHDKKICIWALEDLMAPICIKNWIQHGDPTLTRSQAEKILERIPLLYTFHTLKIKGFMDSLENDRGEEIFFLSEKGKEFGKLMQWNKMKKP
jgi:hypothetical protein